jgi:hypothetical protein
VIVTVFPCQTDASDGSTGTTWMAGAAEDAAAGEAAGEAAGDAAGEAAGLAAGDAAAAGLAAGAAGEAAGLASPAGFAVGDAGAAGAQALLSTAIAIRAMAAQRIGRKNISRFPSTRENGT